MRTPRAAQGLVVALLVTSIALGLGAPSQRMALAADGADVCPESNDGYDTSCYLGPTADVYGFISMQDDVDMYRVEPLEFNVKLHVALTEQPMPYRLAVFNWQGKVMAESSGTGAPSLDVQLGPPGSYYVAVNQLFQGQFSATAPYRLASTLRYPGPMPTVMYSATFRSGGTDADDYDTSEDEDASYEVGHGRLTIHTKQGGTEDDPGDAGYWLPMDDVGDFTLCMDARVVTDTDSGYEIEFRSPPDADDDTGYSLVVQPRDQHVVLRAVNVEKDSNRRLAGTDDKIISPREPNRIVVRGRGDTLIVNVNGKELVKVKDNEFPLGSVEFSAVNWGDNRPVTTFGNILLTTP